MNNGGVTNESEGYFVQYWQHASSLRNWFIAYGIGGIVLFANKSEVFADFSKTTKLWVVILFLIGVLAQALLAFYNKFIQWHVYRGKSDETHKNSWEYKFSDKVSEWFWVDVVVDVITFLALFAGTIIVMVATYNLG